MKFRIRILVPLSRHGGYMDSSLKQKLDRIFEPRSVAVVGVSSRIDNPGTLLLRSLVDMGFEGPLYPVNPKYYEILGLRCYPSVSKIPDPPELVILSIPPKAVPEALKDCADAGVTGCIVNTAGFSELGTAEGTELENSVKEVLKNTGLRIIGPNCMGVYSSRGKLATFAGQKPSEGKIGCISQSGSIVNFLYILGLERNLQFSKMVSSGNELDLNCTDFLEYFAEDTEVQMIIAYLEQIRDPRRFLKIALELKRKKPLLIWKSGITERGRRAAASHTGAIAGSAEVWEAVRKQAGIVPVWDLADAVNVTAIFAFLEKPSGRKVCVISPPGGVAVNTADMVEQSGLVMADFSQKTRADLCKILPMEGTAVGNPVDMGFGSVVPENLYKVIKIVAADESTDIILIVGGAPASRDGDLGLMKMQASEIKRAKSEVKKPIVVVGIPSGFAFPFVSELSWSGIPVYMSPREACSSLARFVDYHGV